MKNILIVEDDILFFNFLKKTLVKNFYEVRGATFAAGAMDEIEFKIPDLIILDLLLDASTAIPLLNELKSHSDLSKIPVIILTGIAERISIDLFKPYGVVEFFDKSTFHINDLLKSIKNITVHEDDKNPSNNSKKN